MYVLVWSRSAATAAGKMQYFFFIWLLFNKSPRSCCWWNVSFGILYVAFLLASFWYIWIKEFHIKSAQILISQYAMISTPRAMSMGLSLTALFFLVLFCSPPKLKKKVYLFLEWGKKDVEPKAAHFFVCKNDHLNWKMILSSCLPSI